MTQEDELLELPSAPVCWLWWAAEPEANRLKLLEEMKAARAERAQSAGGEAHGRAVAPGRSEVLASF